MVKLYNFELQKLGITLVCTVLGLVLSASFLWVLAAVNVLIIGIIHGANDLYIISKYIKTTKIGNGKRLYCNSIPQKNNSRLRTKSKKGYKYDQKGYK